MFCVHTQFIHILALAYHADGYYLAQGYTTPTRPHTGYRSTRLSRILGDHTRAITLQHIIISTPYVYMRIVAPAGSSTHDMIVARVFGSPATLRNSNLTEAGTCEIARTGTLVAGRGTNVRMEVSHESIIE